MIITVPAEKSKHTPHMIDPNRFFFVVRRKQLTISPAFLMASGNASSPVPMLPFSTWMAVSIFLQAQACSDHYFKYFIHYLNLCQLNRVIFISYYVHYMDLFFIHPIMTVYLIGLC